MANGKWQIRRVPRCDRVQKTSGTAKLLCFCRLPAAASKPRCMKSFCVRTKLFIPLVLSFCWLAATRAQPVLPPGPTTDGDGSWRPAGDNLKTKWAQQVRPDHVLPEYPRPELERAQWQNLNGLWDYAI